MKQRLFAIAVILGALVGAVWLWAIRSITEPAPNKPEFGSKRIVLAKTSVAPVPTESPQVSDRKDRRKMFEAVEATNVPINLWGKIVDEDTRPVGGVTIEYEYSIEHGNLDGVAWSNQETRTGQAVSAQDGSFSVRGLIGHALGIVALTHSDYQYRSKGAVSFDFYGSTASGKFVSDPRRPVIFTVVQKRGLEPLIHIKGNLRVQANGPPERWNLWEGELDPKGELMVTFKREPAVLERPGEAATWSAELQIVGGGIIEAAWDDDVRRAPEAGYVDSLLYPDREQKQGVPYRSFYVKTADGRFGRMQIELDARGEGASAPCYIASDMNPRPGSRNLEPSEEE